MKRGTIILALSLALAGVCHASILAAAHRRNAVPSWTPASLSPLVWLRASDITGLSDGDPVGTWVDSSGNGNSATGTSTQRPTYKTGIVNGRPAVRFASPNYLTGAVSVTGTTMSKVWIGKINSGSTSYGRLLSTGVTGTPDYGSTSYSTFVRNASAESLLEYRVTNLATRAITYGASFWAASVFDGTNHTLYVANSAGTPVSATATFSVSNYRIGDDLSASANYIDGDVYEVFIVSRALSGGDRTNIAAYVVATYGF